MDNSNSSVFGRRTLAIMGSTGSIGRQALDVVRQHPDMLRVGMLCANNSWELLAQQAIEFRPEYAVICNPGHYFELQEALRGSGVKALAGMNAAVGLMEEPEFDIVLAAMVGFSGLESTIAALKAGKAVALANKETLVAAGSIVTAVSIEHNAPIIPVDSEHSAIFQCLKGETAGSWCPPYSYTTSENCIEKLVLTASGGPFRTWNIEDIENADAAQALKHPNWSMGAKVTIDSASMLNKGLEIIEASWLFNMPVKDIEVVVHPQSIIHSMVQFKDGCLKAQMGFPDMRVPIQYALTYPFRQSLNTKRISFPELAGLSFFKPDLDRFPALRLAYSAQEKGGSMPCTMNGANEIAVAAFLRGEIKFGAIPHIIEDTMAAADVIGKPSLEDIFQADESARRTAAEALKKYILK